MLAADTVALIAANHSYRASDFLTAAEKCGVSIVLISDGQPDIVPDKQRGLRVDLSRADAAYAIAQQLNANEIRSVIAPDESLLELAAQVSKLLRLTHNPISALQTSTNKYLARSKLRSDGLPVPDFQLIDVVDRTAIQGNQIQYPCVLKPLNMSASRGVIRANNDKEFEQALDRIRSILINEFGKNVKHKVLVEQFVEGSEHVLEGYLNGDKLDTICIFDKPESLQGPYFEETYYVTPSRLSKYIQNEIRTIVLNACRSYGLLAGPVHAEIRVNDNKAWLIETAARSIGGDCSRLFELVTDSSLEEFILLKSLGKKVDCFNVNGGAGVMMIPVPQNGILRRIEGVTEAQSCKHILDVRLDVREGEKLVCWPEGGKYPGYIYAKADTAEQVEFSLRLAYSKLKFVCMPDLPVTVLV